MPHVWLVDQDSVLADFDLEIQKRLEARHPEISLIPLEEHTTFYFGDHYPEKYRPIIESIYNESGFIRDLPVIEGSLLALQEMLALGIDVKICTSPLINIRQCVFEKYEWVERHLGVEWTARLIITRDKTLVKGEFLIDDKPEIIGACVPDWEHIMFDQPYNRKIKDKRRLVGWKNWRKLLLDS